MFSTPKATIFYIFYYFNINNCLWCGFFGYILTSHSRQLLRQKNKTTANLSKNASLEDWIDGQEVMIKLRISPRTLQTLRSNGTIPFTRIGHKLYYLKQDIERILRNNYVMFNIRKRYGEDYW